MIYCRDLLLLSIACLLSLNVQTYVCVQLQATVSNCLTVHAGHWLRAYSGNCWHIEERLQSLFWLVLLVYPAVIWSSWSQVPLGQTSKLATPTSFCIRNQMCILSWGFWLMSATKYLGATHQLLERHNELEATVKSLWRSWWGVWAKCICRTRHYPI